VLVEDAPLSAVPSELRLFGFRGMRGEVAPPAHVVLFGEAVDFHGVLEGSRPDFAAGDLRPAGSELAALLAAGDDDFRFEVGRAFVRSQQCEVFKPEFFETKGFDAARFPADAVDVGLPPFLLLDAPDERDAFKPAGSRKVGPPQSAPFDVGYDRPRNCQRQPETRPFMRASGLRQKPSQPGRGCFREPRDCRAACFSFWFRAFGGCRGGEVFEVAPVGNRSVGVDVHGAGVLRFRMVCAARVVHSERLPFWQTSCLP